MSDPNVNYGKKISDQLTWVIVFLFCITLNTCDAADRIGDLVENREEAAPAPAAAAPAAPAR